MRVLIISHGVQSASARYRALQYIPSLERAGARVTVAPMPAGTRERWRLLRSAAKYEAVLLQKRLTPLWQIALLRRNAKRLVYDFDDAVCFRDSARGATASWTRGRRFRAMACAADLVVAGNDYLASLAAGHAEVVVIPTAVDPAKYDAVARPRSDGAVKLGWIGSGSTLRYLEGLRGALERVGAARPVARLKIVCDAFFDVKALPVEKKTWREADEADDLADIDIGLAPCVEDRWTLGKCGLKSLQYFAASKPVVASPVGVHKEMIRDGKNGYLADTTDAWVSRLLRLIDSPAERGSMGVVGRDLLEARYSLAANAPAFVRAVLGVAQAV